MIVVVSPHLDDAVLSCWSLLDSDDDVAVVTVFTGAPEPGFVSTWDADTGVDSATRMAQRIEENRKALALVGRKPVDLGLAEHQYPGGGVVELDRLRPHLAEAEAVYAPAATAVERPNREHGVVRDAVLELRPDVRLYADQPYSQFRTDTALTDGCGARLRAQAVTLTRAQRRRKLEALRCYAGEMPKLERAYGSFLTTKRLAHELFWV